MAVTRTRTRTQSALNALAKLIAETHGELQVLESLLRPAEADGGKVLRQRKAVEVAVGAPERLEARKHRLVADRDALYATLRQFDAELDPTTIGVSFEWLKKFGRGQASVRRYLNSLRGKDDVSAAPRFTAANATDQ